MTDAWKAEIDDGNMLLSVEKYYKFRAVQWATETGSSISRMIESKSKDVTDFVHTNFYSMTLLCTRRE